MEMARSRIKLFDAGKIDYDGSQITPLWAFRELGVQGDSVVYFRGGMKVSRNALVDVEDLRDSEVEIPISADEALHFIVEHFDHPSLRLAYHRQRILVNVTKEIIISAAKTNIKRDASDLYVNGKKLSVSVATASASSAKIHLGLNITTKGVPKGVDTIGLDELGITDISALAENIAKSYAEEIAEIEDDITKTRVF
jgi:hypothetical protein